jgi:hypothetical protein
VTALREAGQAGFGKWTKSPGALRGGTSRTRRLEIAAALSWTRKDLAIRHEGFKPSHKPMKV